MSTAKKQPVHELSIKNIHADVELQPRDIIDNEVVREYSDAMLEGDQFPPISVFYDGTNYWLADGFHRLKAASKAGLSSIMAVVYQGDRDEAILFAVGANVAHGIRRTNADKKRVVLKMLNHPEWCRWSNDSIARKCHVSSSTVGRYRDNSPGVTGYDVTLRVDCNGKLYDRSNGEAKSEPEPRFTMPPTPLSKSELDNQYHMRITRFMRKVDPSVKSRVETPIGNADIVDGARAYFLATAADRHAMFAVIGRCYLIAGLLGKQCTIVGHFPRSVAPILEAALACGLTYCTPESLIAEAVVKS